MIDQHAKPVASAKVDASGANSATRRSVVTNLEGEFTFGELAPDTYQISATCDTCNDVTNVVEIGAGQSRSIQLGLDTSSSSTIIALDTHGTTVETSAITLGMNVTATEIAALPVNGRTFAQLALTTPLVTNAGAATFSDLRFGGQSIEQNHYTIDDIDNSSVVRSAPSFVPIAGFEFRLRNSLDTVEEFRVDATGYSVEQGFGSGGQIKLLSRSGTNQWHGSVYEYFRNDKLAARNVFDSKSGDELRMNQFGANAGGALIKDKLFLFGSWERLVQRAGLDIIETVPSPLARSVAVANILPVLAAMPPGTQATADSQISLAERRALTTQNESSGSGRLDYLLSGKQRIFLRIARSSGALWAPDSTTPRVLSAISRPDQEVLSWSLQASPNLIDQMSFGINQVPSRAAVDGGVSALAGSRVLTGTQVLGGLASPGGQAQLADSNFGAVADYHGLTYTLRNTVDWTKNRHVIQAGIEFRALRLPFYTQGGLTYAFRDLPSLLNDMDADVTYVANLPPRKAEQENYGGFIQDQWRLSNQTLLIFGLRYEYISATREAENRATVLDPYTLSLRPAQGGFYPASKMGFQPRFALTWAPKSLNGNAVLRLGAGVYNGTNEMLSTLAPIQNSAPKLFLAAATYPFSLSQLVTSGETRAEPKALDPRTFGRPQRNYLFTASLQAALPGKFVTQVGYSGILSRHLTQQTIANPALGINPDDSETIRARDDYSAVLNLANRGTSSYNGLQLGLNRHLVDNLTMSASYSLSHSIGDTSGAGDETVVQNPLCLACDRGDNGFDVRHTFSFNSVYEIPIGKERRHLNNSAWSALLGGWALAGVWSFRSGLPVNVTIDRADEIFYSPSSNQYYSPSSKLLPTDALSVTNAPYGVEGLGGLRPSIVPGVDPYAKNSLQWLNPAAFATPLPGTFGDLGRNSLRGPNFSQFDFELSRTLALPKRGRLEIKAELFNVLNHPNFSNPTALLPDVTNAIQPGTPYNYALAPNFGRLNSTIGRTVGLGTSRNLQLSMRVTF